jgi:RND family efflux transporter MFP subunit
MINTSSYRSATAGRFAVAGLVLALLSACSDTGKAPAPAAPPPPNVTVAKPQIRQVVDEDEYVGRFVAQNAVEIRARVSGYLEQVHFKDGAYVKQGDLLFSIDPRPFRNTLDQARANLEQARSNAVFAESDFGRAQLLAREKTITDQALDQRAQSLRNALAAVAANEALVRQAELDLQFTELRAPIEGRIGDRRVSPGNLVTGGTAGNTTLLASIVSLDPIRFEFTFDEAAFLRYKRIRPQATDATAQQPVPVQLKLIDDKGFAHAGAIDFIDNVIDKSSGTMRGRAIFANKLDLFTPGMFGRLKVSGSLPYQAFLIPDAAIGTEQVRKFVYVVGADDVVALKYVVPGQMSDGLRVIKDGLAAGDRVIVNGLMRVRPGIKVTPSEAASTPTPAPSR